MANIDKPFQDAAFDPGRKHSIPYMWGTLGIGYRKSKVEGVIDSWNAVYAGDNYQGRVSLLGDAGAVIGCALKLLGYSYNSVSADEIKKAEELIIANKKNIKVFADD